MASRSSLFSVAALSSSFNKYFLLIASPSFSFKLVGFRCGSFPVVPSLFFSLQRCPPLLISPSSYLLLLPFCLYKLVRFRCGSFPVVPSLFFSLQRCPPLLISPSSYLLLLPFRLYKLVRFRCGSFPVVPSLFFRCSVVRFS